MSTVAIIGGSGFQSLGSLQIEEKICVKTQYGEAHLELGSVEGQRVVFLTRHGEGHSIAPHQINYRANISALKSMGVDSVIAVNAVGSIRQEWEPGCIVVPHQLIDYTWGRESTFYDARDSREPDSEASIAVQHADFGEPYSEPLRQLLLEALAEQAYDCGKEGVYACTQGPRLETAAEIQRLKRDGCDLVGMTGMPEAALARELGLEYTSLCLVVNPASGVSSAAHSLDEIMSTLEQGMEKVQILINSVIASIQAQSQ